VALVYKRLLIFKDIRNEIYHSENKDSYNAISLHVQYIAVFESGKVDCALSMP